MAANIKRTFLRAIPHIFTDFIGNFLVRIFVKKKITGWMTDKFLEILLKGMDLAFCLSKGYRKNIENFDAKYLFSSADNTVAASAIFRNNDMEVKEEAINDWDTKVTFKNAKALRTFLFSKDHDILNSILANEVEVSGNLNLLFKFGFLAKDLQHRAGF